MLASIEHAELVERAGEAPAERNGRVDADAVVGAIGQFSGDRDRTDHGVHGQAEEVLVFAVVDEEVVDHQRIGICARGVANEGQLVVIALVEEAELRFDFLDGPAQRYAVLAAVLRRAFTAIGRRQPCGHQRCLVQAADQRITAMPGGRTGRAGSCPQQTIDVARGVEDRLPPLTHHGGVGVVGTHRIESVGVPLELVVGLEVQGVGQAHVERGHRRGDEHLFQLGARGVVLGLAEGIDLVDAAGDEDFLTPADDLVAHLHLGRHVANVEALGHPQVQQVQAFGGVALGLVIQFGAAGVVHLEVFRPGKAPQGTPAIAELQAQLMGALDHMGKDIVLVVVEVAVVSVGEVDVLVDVTVAPAQVVELPQFRVGAFVTAAAIAAKDVAVARLQPLGETVGQRGVEAAGDALLRAETKRMAGLHPEQTGCSHHRQGEAVFGAREARRGEGRALIVVMHGDSSNSRKAAPRSRAWRDS